MPITIEHEIEKQRFIFVNTNEAAILEYSINVENTEIDFIKTYVPEALRGQGIAEKLVRKGLGWAKVKSYKIHATCWYVKKFL